jgi:DNA-binding protein H-NS
MPRKSKNGADLSRLSIAELEALVERAKRERGTKTQKLVARVRKLASSSGVSVEDLVAALGGASGTRRGGRKPGRKPGRKAARKGGRRAAAKAAKTAKRANGAGRKRRASPTKGVKIAPKYRHPENAALTWSGRGVQARWIGEWLKEKKGRKIEDLAVTQ